MSENSASAIHQHRPRIATGFLYAVLILAVVLLYLSTLSHNYMGDGIQFATAVKYARIENLMLPNHMLYPVFGLWFYRLWLLFGWQGSTLLPLQVLSAVGGALAVGMMAALSHRITYSKKIAALIAVGFALSHGIWLYSTDVEVITLPFALSLVVLWQLLSHKAERPNWQTSPTVVGLATGVAILIYQTCVFLAPTAIVAYWLNKNEKAILRLRSIMLFLAAVSLVTIPTYLFVAVYVYGVSNWQELLQWQFHMSGLGLWGTLSPKNIAQAAYSFLKTLAGYPGLGPSTRTTLFFDQATFLERTFFGLYYGFILLATMIPMALVVARRSFIKIHQRQLAILACWGVLYGAFGIYWVPGDTQFFVPLLAPWWLVTSLVLAESKHHVSEESGRFRSFIERRFGVFLILFILVLFVANFAGVILPNRKLANNRPYQITKSIAEQTTLDDLIITSGGDRLFLYIPYFTERPTLSVFHELLHTTKDKSEVFAEINQKVSQVHAAGGRVFLVGVQPGQDVWWDIISTVGLTREDFADFQSAPGWSVEGEEIREVTP